MKIKKSLFALSVLMTTLSFSNLNATLVTDKIIEAKRIEKINNIVELENFVLKRTIGYVVATADLTPTRAELQAYHNLSSDSFKNYQGETCALSGSNCTNNTSGGITLIFNTTNNEIRIGNVLGDVANLSQTEINQYLNSTEKAPESTTASDYSYRKFTISDYDKLNSTIKIINASATNTKTVISTTTPTDNTKIWLKPNGDGTFEALIWNSATNKWESKGSITGLNSLGTYAELTFYLNDGFDPATTLGQQGWIANVETADGFIQYKHNGTQWVKMLSSGDGSQLLVDEDANNIGDLLDRNDTNKFFNSKPGSTVNVRGLIGVTNVKFSRKLNYWRSDTAVSYANYAGAGTVNNFMYVAEKKEDLPIIDASGAIAWIKTNNISTNGSNNVGFKGDNSYYELVLHGGVWLNVVPNLSNLVLNASYTAGDYWDLETKQRFNSPTTKAETASVHRYWNKTYPSTSVSSPAFVITRGDRTDLPVATNTTPARISLTGIAGDEVNYGTIDSIYTYSGTNKFKMWYYSPTGGYKYMIDATSVASIAAGYGGNYEAFMVGSVVYLKDKDSLNRDCYKNTSGTYYTSSGTAIPTGNNLPPADTCSTATYSGNYLVLSNRTEATAWTTAPHGAGVQIGGTNYVHITTNGDDFWTNNGSGDGQVSATEIFTKGSRTSFPVITHSINALTKLVDTPNYTTTGVVSSIDNSFKQWFYSSSGTRVNSLLDNPCLSRGLIADFANATCYKQTSTVVTNNGKWQWYNSFHKIWYDITGEVTAGSCSPTFQWTTCNYRQSSETYYPPSHYIGYSYTIDVTVCGGDGSSNYAGRCVLSSTTYTCSSGYPTKLNNSICEYREAF